MAKQGMKRFYIKHNKMDNDLAVENMVNDFDMTMADLQDMGELE